MATLRFKLDEGLPRDAAEWLRRLGHDVQTVHDEHLSGAPDSVVAAAFRQEDRVLVTLDLDFADIRAYPPEEMPGIIVLRPAAESIRAILDLLEHASQALTIEPVTCRLWVVEPNRIRVRGG